MLIAPCRAELTSAHHRRAPDQRKGGAGQGAPQRNGDARSAFVVVLFALLGILVIGDPGRIDRGSAWLRLLTGTLMGLTCARKRKRRGQPGRRDRTGRRGRQSLAARYGRGVPSLISYRADAPGS